MGDLRKLYLGLLALFVIVAVLGITGWLIWSASELFSRSSDNVKAASIAALASVALFVLGRYFEQSRERKARLNQEKTRVYERFFDLFFDLFKQSKFPDKDRDPDFLVKGLLEFQKELVLWGSDSVLKEYISFRESLPGVAATGSAEPVDLDKLAGMFRATAKLLKAMRSDIGYRFSTFGTKDLAILILQGDDPEVIKLMKKLENI